MNKNFIIDFSMEKNRNVKNYFILKSITIKERLFNFLEKYKTVLKSFSLIKSFKNIFSMAEYFLSFVYSKSSKQRNGSYFLSSNGSTDLIPDLDFRIADWSSGSKIDTVNNDASSE